jgi:hypothetical protein
MDLLDVLILERLVVATLHTRPDRPLVLGQGRSPLSPARRTPAAPAAINLDVAHRKLLGL